MNSGDENVQVELDEEDVAAMEYVNFTREEAIAFKEIYYYYDQTYGKGDGNCSVKLMKSMVTALGVSMNNDNMVELEGMLRAVDDEWAAKTGGIADGQTQFPEFLLLIHKMQKNNFCNMNGAAEDAVRQQAEADARKAEHAKAKAGSKEKRQSQVYMEQQKIQEQLASLEAEGGKKAAEEAEIEVPDDTPQFSLRAYDKNTDGEYKLFYIKHHKKALDEWAKTHQEGKEAAKAYSKAY